MDIQYILLEEVTYGEKVPLSLLDELLGLELVDYRRESPDVIYIAEPHCEVLRTMLRLSTDLSINAAGIETIMHMRQRLTELNREVRRLRQLEAAYHAMRPASVIEEV